MDASNERSPSVVAGYAVGVGVCAMATVGVWLQYSTATFDALTAGLVSLAGGAVLGAAWALLRPRPPA